MANFISSNLSVKEQIQRIVDSPDARITSQSLPPEDLLLLINKAGKNDSLELIELLSSTQIQAMFDLDVWMRDSLDEAKLEDWLLALESVSPEGILEQTQHLDIEFLTILLKNSCIIFDLLENDDPYFDSDLVLYTLDKHYLLAFNTDERHLATSRFLKRLLEHMMGNDFLEAIKLIESARFETDSLLQEDALRLRDGRLQDMGFLPFSETLSILGFVDVEKAREKTIVFDDKKSDEKTFSRSTYKLPSLNELPFLRESLTGLSHVALENAWGYIVTVTNRVHMARYGNYCDVDDVTSTATYTLNFIEMGLAYLSNGDLSRSKQVYLSHVPQDLFKIGHSLVLRIHRDFLRMAKHPAFTLSISSTARLDSPLREVIVGILRNEPQFFDGLIDPQLGTYRDFRNLQDVAHASRAISEIMFRCALLGENGLNFQETNKQSNPDLPSMGVLLATYYVHVLLRGQGSFQSISRKDFLEMFNRLIKTDSGLRISETDKKACIAFTRAVAGNLVSLPGIRTVELAQEKATNYANTVLGFMESEFAHLSINDLDFSLIQSVMIE